jgi:hypothetical protein
LVVVASLAPEPFPVASPDDDALPNSDEVHARYAAMIPEKNKSHTRMGHIAFPTAAPGRGLKRTPCRAARGDVWSRREEPCKVCECFTGGGARVVVARPGRRFSWEDVFCSEGNCVSKKPMKLNRNVREKIHLKATLPSSRGRHTRGDDRRLRERREAAAGSGCVRRGEAGRASRRESAARRGSEAGREGKKAWRRRA